MYDHIPKQITKETTCTILKEDGMDKMHIDKRIFIHNTIAGSVEMGTVGTIVSQAIEENTRAMSLDIKQLCERIIQLEI